MFTLRNFCKQGVWSPDKRMCHDNGSHRRVRFPQIPDKLYVSTHTRGFSLHHESATGKTTLKCLFKLNCGVLVKIYGYLECSLPLIDNGKCTLDIINIRAFQINLIVWWWLQTFKRRDCTLFHADVACMFRANPNNAATFTPAAAATANRAVNCLPFIIII